MSWKGQNRGLLCSLDKLNGSYMTLSLANLFYLQGLVALLLTLPSMAA
jgi:hypothetical protein